MVKQIIVCDKCGKHIESGNNCVNGFDFCEKCNTSLMVVIKNWLAPEQSENQVQNIEKPSSANNQAPKKPVRIDWDKACALKIAGWKNKDIADELKCSEGTIHVGIVSHMKKYKAERGE